MKVHIGPYPSGKSKKERKINIKVDDYDTWGADHTLALVILPVLQLLNKKKQGAPAVDDEDVPEKIKSTNAPPKKEEYDADKFFFKRWNFVMDEMIWAFKQLADVESDYKFIKKGKYDVEGLKKHNDRIANGLRLFAKYYRGLWD